MHGVTPLCVIVTEIRRPCGNLSILRVLCSQQSKGERKQKKVLTGREEVGERDSTKTKYWVNRPGGKVRDEKGGEDQKPKYLVSQKVRTTIPVRRSNVTTTTLRRSTLFEFLKQNVFRD